MPAIEGGRVPRRKQLALEPGQTVIAHGLDRGLDPDELNARTTTSAHGTWQFAVPVGHGR
jgi:hypothetical protein